MSAQIKKLIEGLNQIPNHWLIVPTKMKMALGIGWQRNPYLPSELQLKLIDNYKLNVLTKYGYRNVAPTGFGLKCGANSKEFLLAIDCDGIEAYRHIVKINYGISKEEIKRIDDETILVLSKKYLPDTVCFSSGRRHRKQYLYKADLKMQYVLKSRIIDVGNGNHLELRGTDLNSILPPSQHPMGRNYKWVIGSPNTIPVAPAPDWILKLMVQRQTKKLKVPKIKASGCTQEESPTEIETARNILEAIHPKYADDYHNWISTGMALKSISNSLFPDWDKWSQISHKYQSGMCAYKWGTFNNLRCTIRTLYYLADNS